MNIIIEYVLLAGVSALTTYFLYQRERRSFQLANQAMEVLEDILRIVPQNESGEELSRSLGRDASRISQWQKLSSFERILSEAPCDQHSIDNLLTIYDTVYDELPEQCSSGSGSDEELKQESKSENGGVASAIEASDRLAIELDDTNDSDEDSLIIHETEAEPIKVNHEKSEGDGLHHYLDEIAIDNGDSFSNEAEPSQDLSDTASIVSVFQTNPDIRDAQVLASEFIEE